MKARQVFGVLVRTFGLTLTLYGLYDGFYTVMRLIGIPTPYQVAPLTTAVVGCVFLLVGVMLTRWAEWVVRFAYGSEPAPALDSN